MDAYSKASSVSVSEEEKDPCEVQIKSGKKIRTSISQALKILQTSKERVIISGSGPTITKAIATAEIVKRKIKASLSVRSVGLLALSKIEKQEVVYKLLQEDLERILFLPSCLPGKMEDVTLKPTFLQLLIEDGKPNLSMPLGFLCCSTEDLWEPKEEGLDRLKVIRNIPSIRILLSHTPLDNKALGYQAPGVSWPLIQFRDEDIELADETNEGKTSLRQSPSHQYAYKGRTGHKHDRKQKPYKNRKHLKKETEQQSETEKGNSTSKVNVDTRNLAQNKGTRRKHGGYYSGNKPSKRPHSDKPSQKAEAPRNENQSESRTFQASS